MVISLINDGFGLKSIVGRNIFFKGCSKITSSGFSRCVHLCYYVFVIKGLSSVFSVV